MPILSLSGASLLQKENNLRQTMKYFDAAEKTHAGTATRTRKSTSIGLTKKYVFILDKWQSNGFHTMKINLIY